MTESAKGEYYELVGTRILTYNEFSKIPYDGLGHHLINGVHRITPAPSTKHQEISNKVSYLLNQFAIEKQTGKVFTALIDVKFSEKDGFQPDLIFIGQSHLDIVTTQYIDGSPDLVIEVLSPSSEEADFGWKKELIEKYDVKEYWVIDPYDGKIHQFIRNKQQKLELKEIYTENDVINPEIKELQNVKIQVNNILGLLLVLCSFYWARYLMSLITNNEKLER